MSIIEKAIDKLNSGPKEERPAETEAPAPGSPAPESPITERKESQYREINLAKLKKKNFVTPQGEYTPFAEEFRMIKRPLLDNAFDPQVKKGNLIMVTSALPGEGKTYCTINLAMSIAMEMDKTVLLVDADVSKPSVLQQLGITADRGLLDLLIEKDLKPSDVLIKTNIENLSILPSGRSHRKATELLASEAMAELIDDMAKRYPDRIIIFDSPPLLVTTEASVLASHMGQIVMIISSDNTPQAAFKDALSLIDSCDIVGVVLNKAKASLGKGYGYGYGYGYRAKHE